MDIKVPPVLADSCPAAGASPHGRPRLVVYQPPHLYNPKINYHETITNI